MIEIVIQYFHEEVLELCFLIFRESVYLFLNVYL